MEPDHTRGDFLASHQFTYTNLCNHALLYFVRAFHLPRAGHDVLRHVGVRGAAPAEGVAAGVSRVRYVSKQRTLVGR